LERKNTYSLKQLITIELFGQPYTFKSESEITGAKEVAESLVKEVARVETQQSGKASDITKLVILISAALNIANENFELKRNYSNLLQELSERLASLIRTLSANMQ
jgi:cell division protein ZapA (FtsZ GTPase activity inhibitor)